MILSLVNNKGGAISFAHDTLNTAYADIDAAWKPQSGVHTAKTGAL